MKLEIFNMANPASEKVLPTLVIPKTNLESGEFWMVAIPMLPFSLGIPKGDVFCAIKKDCASFKSTGLGDGAFIEFESLFKFRLYEGNESNLKKTGHFLNLDKSPELKSDFAACMGSKKIVQLLSEFNSLPVAF